MNHRQLALVYGFALFLLCCAIGYNLNDGHPSIPWALAGAAAGTVLAVAVRKRTGRPGGSQGSGR
ncbi:hypothetical protein ACWDNT_12440 [Streptomyces sp. NPDC000963]|uniref:hypothetical protein n=1 Tax=Streptomyces sp. NPDC007872 TaxID=3364782 RepID=UPI00367EEBBE